MTKMLIWDNFHKCGCHIKISVISVGDNESTRSSEFQLEFSKIVHNFAPGKFAETPN